MDNGGYQDYLQAIGEEEQWYDQLDKDIAYIGEFDLGFEEKVNYG